MSFTNNTGSNGGALYVNSAVPFTLTNVSFTGNYATGDGGAIYTDINSYLPTFSDISFNTNTAHDNAGAIYVNSPINVLSVVNCDFYNNTALYYFGGAIAAYGAAFSILNSQFRNNSNYYIIRGWGGGLYTTNSNANNLIQGCTFSGNFGSVGAGIGADNSTVFIRSTNFSYNHAVTAGAGFYQHTGYSEVTDCKFYNGRSDYSGGAITTEGAGSTIVVRNVDVQYNSADGNGGGMFFSQGSTATVIGGSFIYNSVTGTSGFGGALTISSTNAFVSGINVHNNSATYGGGVALGSSNVTIYNSVVSTNNAIIIFLFFDS